MTSHPSPGARQGPAVSVVMRLPRAQREVWVACRIECLDRANVAGLLGISMRAVPGLLKEADRSLLRILQSDPACRGMTLDSLRAAFADETEPSPEEVERLVESPAVRRAMKMAGKPRASLRRLLPVASLAAVTLAAVLFWFTGYHGTRTQATDTPALPGPVALEPGFASRSLLSPSQPVTLVLESGVKLRYQGTGRLQAPSRALRVDWESGFLQVSVPPGKGLDLVVSTADARVEVVGTSYRLTRDALGTNVIVDSGHVRVECRHGDEAHPGVASAHGLAVGQELLCLPGTDFGFLSRALALQQGGAPASKVQAAAEAGLALAGTSSDYRGELFWLRLQALEAGGDTDAALLAVETCLDAVPACLGRDRLRVVDLRRTAARMAYDAAGCEAALPYLEDLAPLEHGLDLFALARCLEGTDPQRACSLLQQLRARGLEPQLAAQVRALSRRLGERCP